MPMAEDLVPPPPFLSSSFIFYPSGTLVSGPLSFPEDMHGSRSKETLLTYTDEQLISYNCFRVERRVERK